MKAAAAALAAAFCLTFAWPRAASAAPARDWSRSVAATAQGGFIMGNPKARLKLIEYGSMTCPHCRAFESEGVPALIGTYVRSGQVSWEFRNYVRDAFDITAALVARCNGARNFFPLTRALYRDQPAWVGKAQAAPQEQLDALDKLPPERRFGELAKIAGLQSWAAAHGLPPTRISQCLANGKAVMQLIQMTRSATRLYPDFAGTPTFVIDGRMLERTATWKDLEPALRKALGG